MFILWKWSEVKWSEVKWKSLVVSGSLWPRGLYSPWNSPGQNTGVGSFFLLQGIFPTQGLNPGLPHCWWILYQLSHKGSPYTKVRVKCLCPVGGERRVSSLLGFLKNLFKIHAGKNKYIKFTQEVAGAEDRGGEERSRQWGKTIDEEENRHWAEQGLRRRIEGAESNFTCDTHWLEKAVWLLRCIALCRVYLTGCVRYTFFFF